MSNYKSVICIAALAEGCSIDELPLDNRSDRMCFLGSGQTCRSIYAVKRAACALQRKSIAIQNNVEPTIKNTMQLKGKNNEIKHR